MALLLLSSFPIIVWGLSPIVFLLCLGVAFRARGGELITKCISILINRYLVFRYPIRRQGNGELIPSCPYEWPNGQGDVGKFLQGIENSDVWEKRYGSIYRIWSGLKSEIVLTRPDHLRTVFKDSNKHRKAVDNNSGYLMSQVLGQCVGLVSGNEWQTLRKVTEAPFQHKTVNAYVADVREQVKAYLHHLEAGKNFSRGMLDPALDMKMLPFFVVAQLFYGPLSAEMVERLRELAPLREELFRHVIRGGLSRFRFSRILPTRANHLLATFKKQWATFNTSAYERAVALGLDVPIISMFKAVQSSQVSMEQLLQTLDESLYANLDVTTGALSWNLVFLATNSAVQSKVRDEIISHYGDDLHSYIQSSSTLLAACTLESSRLRPLAAFSVPQSTPTDRVVDGYLIPAGTDFVVDSYALNVRHDFWGPDTKEYRPERWLELNQSDLRYHFWRFGFGPRQCMGKYVADVILRALIIELLTVYSLDLSDKEQQVCGRDPNSWITHPQTLLRCTKLA